MTVPLLEVVDLVKDYRLARPSWFAPHAIRRAVDGVSLTIHPGRSFGNPARASRRWRAP
jgi:ABC-type oligopeptide transport system ATPase subunit